MHITLKTVIASIALAAAASPVSAQSNNQLQRCLAPNNGGGGLSVIGLTSTQGLVCFKENKSDRVFPIGTVQGLTGDTALIGIDYRVQNGLLYGVGNTGGVYVLDTTNAAATLVNRLTSDGTAPVALSGTDFGVDFNPAADRLRIVSDTGQNLRHNVNPGGVTLVDGSLNNGATPAVVTSGVVAAAYTNNDLNVAATGTLLFDINATADQLAVQIPPNSGTLSAIGALTVDTGSIAGFDIYSTLNNGISVANQGLAVLTINASSSLYSINLLTGMATLRGPAVDVVDIAIPLNQP